MKTESVTARIPEKLLDEIDAFRSGDYDLNRSQEIIQLLKEAVAARKAAQLPGQHHEGEAGDPPRRETKEQRVKEFAHDIIKQARDTGAVISSQDVTEYVNNKVIRPDSREYYNKNVTARIAAYAAECEPLMWRP
jgi:hypothetical protein